ncbi:hypothetical protein NEOLI_003656 [Neolecta irregularis DAH-3]|uniref:Uncharacterized protein n=1 Tax=Neolecta irregularis (strain DAH-3) TaxID=1198029 RepID=A0A1U7LNK8_NEOID|nr:hypothetical protein NEOLI_003656 [Neolecta irregularis DAH-3]|eukprot:OLL24219.1 hypothetical protein NEOLI_003656 [Neolecta irregularis DAH-3]
MLSLNGTTGIGILDICKRASSVQRKSKGHVDAEEFIARRFLLARPINASVLSQRDTLRNKGLEIYALNGSRQTSRNDKDCKGKWPNRGRALWKLPPLNVHHSYASNHTNPLPPIQAYQHLNLPRHQTGLRQLASRQVPGRMVVPRPRSSHPPLHPVYRPPNAGM